MDIPLIQVPADSRRIAVVIASTPCVLRNKLFDTISRSEQIRADKISNSRKQSDFIFARSIVRRSLSHTLAITPCDIPIDIDTYGRPFLNSSFEERGNIFFSITHSDGLVGVALTKHGPVGIDLEKISQFQHSEKLPKVLCSNLKSSNASAATLADLWTLREAILKAYGTGFMIPQETIRINHKEDQGVCFLELDSEQTLPYCVTTIDKVPDYSCSVAVSSASSDAIFSFYPNPDLERVKIM